MVLKKMVAGNISSEKFIDTAVAESIDFMLERVYIFYMHT